jgi:hypothetical protein
MQNKRVARKNKESKAVVTNTNHVLSVADSFKPIFDFLTVFEHIGLKMDLLKTEAVVVISCDGLLLLSLLFFIIII